MSAKFLIVKKNIYKFLQHLSTYTRKKINHRNVTHSLYQVMSAIRNKL